MYDENEKYELNNDKKAPEPKKQTSMLSAAFMLFVLPIVCVFLGVFLGGYVAGFMNSYFLAFKIAGGVIGFVLAVVIMRIFDRKAKNDKPDRYYWESM